VPFGGGFGVLAAGGGFITLRGGAFNTDGGNLSFRLRIEVPSHYYAE